MTKKKSLILQLASVSVACVLGAGVFSPYGKSLAVNGATEQGQLVNRYNGTFDSGKENYFDSSVMYRLPETVEMDQDISVIVEMSTGTLLDAYKASGSKLTVAEYGATGEGVRVLNNIERDRRALVRKLSKSGIKYEMGDSYDTVLSGFEITVKASEYNALQKLLASDAKLIIGEEYEKASAEVVENDVNVYSTGIFDSSSSEYQGNGVVIAVLDTGLDYTHTAFSVDNFTTPDSDLAFTLGDGTAKDVAKKINGTTASTLTAGLTGEDVYISKKVPFAYDYADKDPDVLPINSEHGTHVAGIIAGKDDVITGVAPNAQLAIFKVFSDTATGAKQSWILSALDDCVKLGVDVINMSLGSSCGFSREVDKKETNEIYDSIKEAGISLICAASNDYNATFGSEKNGNLGLTSNPDSGTVGSPATYSAALAVASISGVKTPYMLFNDQVVYFKEANDKASKPKNFVNEILGANENSKTFEYVVINGFGTDVDYEGVDVKGKIALVKRGTTMFEDKIKSATNAGAAGIIIYNNVSGEISMSVGSAVAPSCSISQDDGEMLFEAANQNGGVGKISISRDQVAGPFMSDFSSWGPTSDLKIKPEITAHGGDILSAIPGQGYDKLSGTSMASPNQAGVTSLIRQYVKEHVAQNPEDTVDVTALVNRIMMSTTDIAYNKNGLPYAVRKQGAGLANLTKATTTPAYLTTYENGVAMDKTKLELGDDKTKSGVYNMTFEINNISSNALTYDVDAIVMTEGVSKTYTSHGETTVTEEGYLLSCSERKISSVDGGTFSGNTVTVDANKKATVTFTVSLSDEDKKYLDASFENGMYIEGFVTLTARGNNNINLNVPFLSFYGDWTKAPIFDEEYYDTNPDEIDAGIDVGDKVMADAWATRVIGSLYSDYIAYLGSYYFIQDPTATQIAASKDKIAISNQNQGDSGNTAINSISSVWAGLLRNAKHVDIQVVEDSTGDVVYENTQWNIRKSYNHGGAIYYGNVEFEFAALERNLKNNTKYTVTLDAYIDTPDAEQKNARSRFEFPLYIDFEAPVVTDVNYRTVYDKINKTTKLYADISVYDNHYAMALQYGRVYMDEGRLTLASMGKYMTPVYSTFNSTSVVTIELTDYINELKNTVGISYDAQGNGGLVYNNNSFVAIVYDYAMNSATYEIRLPDDFESMFFDVSADSKKDALNKRQVEAGNVANDGQALVLSPNETYELSEILKIYPSSSWVSILDYAVANENNVDVIGVVNGTVVARNSGKSQITVTGKNSKGEEIKATLDVIVLSSSDTSLGYVKYDPVAANKFEITGFTADRAFYRPSSSDREIGIEGGHSEFGNSLSLSMFPSEQVTLEYTLNSYFPDRTSVVFSSSREDIVSVDQTGKITAHYTANRDTVAYITVTLNLDGQRNTSIRIPVTVKNPFVTNAIYLQNYFGGGDADGVVVIPDDLGITTIYLYSFSGYRMVEKDIENGDEISEEEPYHQKQQFIGNDLIKKVIIPEGVTEISEYAFANLSELREVVLPSTLKKIGLGAFRDCKKLKTINLEHVQFINKDAFYGTAIETADFASVVSFGDYAFMGSAIKWLNLPASCQSIGIGSFQNCENLANVTFNASKVKIGTYAFSGCKVLASININAAVIASYAFSGCNSLTNVTLGRDVAIIGEYAFTGTKVARFNVDPLNKALTTNSDKNIIYKGNQLLLVAPLYDARAITLPANITSIATGAFAEHANLQTVTAQGVTEVGDYAFAGCTDLRTVNMPNLVSVGVFAFVRTALIVLPNAAKLTSIGDYAFGGTGITSLTLADNAEVGAFAFDLCANLKTVNLGNNVVLGEGAFARTAVAQVTAGENLQVGDSAFINDKSLKTVVLGEGAVIGGYAFAGCSALSGIDLSKAVSLGDFAFASCTAIETADLSNAATLGENLFNGATSLSSVTFSDSLTAIPAGAFYGCRSLTSVTLGENIKEVGEKAFANTALTQINLENVLTIGDNAFRATALENVTFAEEGAEIGEYAFYKVTNLAVVNNLDKVVHIGTYAFAGTAIEEANLASAQYVDDYAFAYSALTSVSFGVEIGENGNVTKSGSLVYLGENPFVGCEISTYGAAAQIKFNGNTVATELVEDYNISEYVKVSGGALYLAVPNGWQLVSYPMLREAVMFEVEEGTVRISARAFQGSAVQGATIASTVKAIGDKAFFGCGNLNLVVFKSLNAPILEEEYNKKYVDDAYPLPYPGYYPTSDGVYKNLGITKYYMWNVITNSGTAYSNFYFGANFVNYIGLIDNKLTMVKPVNGRNYDTFIYGQYFNTVIDGATAATEATLEAIRAIAAIPETVELTDECVALVEAARAAYNAIGSLDQQALVSNYAKLTAAERRLEFLRTQTVVDVPPQTEPDSVNVGLIVGLSVGGGVLLIAAVTVILLIKFNVIKLKKNPFAKKEETADTTDNK